MAWMSEAKLEAELLTKNKLHTKCFYVLTHLLKNRSAVRLFFKIVLSSYFSCITCVYKKELESLQTGRRFTWLCLEASRGNELSLLLKLQFSSI